MDRPAELSGSSRARSTARSPLLRRRGSLLWWVFARARVVVALIAVVVLAGISWGGFTVYQRVTQEPQVVVVTTMAPATGSSVEPSSDPNLSPEPPIEVTPPSSPAPAEPAPEPEPEPAPEPEPEPEPEPSPTPEPEPTRTRAPATTQAPQPAPATTQAPAPAPAPAPVQTATTSLSVTCSGDARVTFTSNGSISVSGAASGSGSGSVTVSGSGTFHARAEAPSSVQLYWSSSGAACQG
ncbi:hypothetical protein Bequi_13465 [Brachybacterium sp. JHP9]|uniref:Ig-like domain-containing protein n=1 Tax=Brachybacterium equifaecis TaxID=2910770 RepID=A0ABT0R4M7_9MICO|nr:hypothetical protein [Brachybacterium equifaecis]MCL6424373.1 hypothetical protein [Brachybacterium equifaecis]